MTDEPQVTYRPATKQDIEPIVSIAREIWHVGMSKALEDRHGVVAGKPWQDHIADSMRSAITSRISTNSCIVAEVSGHVVGWGTWWLDEAKSIGAVGYNGVHPDFRGHGIGTEIIRRIIEELRKAGMRIATVRTGLAEGAAPARAVYRKVGFKPLFESVDYTMEL